MRGLQIASRKQLCVFVDGQLDTEDPHVIEKLLSRPDLFWVGREDIDYRALAYPQLIAEAERLNIRTYKVSKKDLLKALIHYDKDHEVSKVVEEVKAPKVVEKVKTREEEIEELERQLEEPKEKEVIKQ
jgi:hypothetical protein